MGAERRTPSKTGQLTSLYVWGGFFLKKQKIL